MKKKCNENKNKEETIEMIFKVTSKGKDENGLEFSVGDKYRILEADGDSILIEKPEDNNNPYFVAGTFLSEISNFNNTDMTNPK